MQESIIKYFGKDIDLTERIKSYSYLEKFIENNVKNWNYSPNTDQLSLKFQKEIANLDKSNFAFLICHSGFIPEFYAHDSSQETLYSKLIEALVCEWAIRVGFIDSHLQKQKSNKEDISILNEKNIIVCDAKSFRLGRSQAAPNVKDTIKKAAYVAWLNGYGDDYNKLGGLISFPSLHDWQKQSEAYKYFTEGNPPVVLLFYEHMSFMLLNDIREKDLIEFMNNYPKIYDGYSKNKEVYFNGLFKFLFKEKFDKWKEYTKIYTDILKERIDYLIKEIDSHLKKVHDSISKEVEKIPVDKLKHNVIEERYYRECNQLIKQKSNILKFRKI